MLQSDTKIIDVSKFYAEISRFEYTIVKNVKLEKIAFKD